MRRLVGWLWARWSHRWRAVTIVATIVATLALLTIPTVVGATMYLRLDRIEFAALLVNACAVVAIGVTGGLLTFGRRTYRFIDEFLDGETTAAGRRELRELIDGAVRRLTRQVVVFIMVPAMMLLSASFAGWLAHEGWEGLLAAEVALLMVLAIARTVMAVGLDALFDPLREELDQLGTRARPSEMWPLSSRLAAVSGASAWAVAMLTGAAVARQSSPAGQLLVGACTAAVLALYGYIMFRVLGLDPVLRPVGDLLEATKRIGRGDYDERVPVLIADELGELAESFNTMQEGLSERERLRSAFGSYVDPALADRLLEQGDDLFAGEEIEATIMFLDVRDFTPFAARVSAATAVAQLNALFGVVVPILHEHLGHANKYLGDGVLAVFGAPNRLPDHADAAVRAALDVQRSVGGVFGEELRLGIGINTGRVIAGTVGGGGKLEFTLIGDAVNVAARVEQFTKETGDGILVTEATAAALEDRSRLVSRGGSELKGTSRLVELFALAG